MVESYSKMGLEREKWRLKWLLFVLVPGIFMISGTLFYLRHRTYERPVFFPTNTLQEVQGFHLYGLKQSFSTDFMLQPRTISYRSGTLIFELKNPRGKALAFTEEATPASYDISSLRADRQFTTEYGQAFITDGATRTTGTLFTQDRTWILIDAPNPIGADLMEQIIDALQPIS